MSTIIIGLGSTGRYVVEKVRQLHLQFTGTAKPNDVDYLAFDTEETLEQRDDGITRVWMSLRDVRAQVPILKRREGTKWIPDADDVTRITVTEAAGISAIGRLALWMNWNRVDTALRNARTRIGGDAANLNVFIVGALTGGTCTGSFIDFAYLCRSTLKTENIFGLFLIPGRANANNNVNERNSLENYLMAISSLKHYSDDRNEYKCLWPNINVAYNNNHRPYEQTWFLSFDYSTGAAPIPRENVSELVRVAALNLCSRIIDNGEFHTKYTRSMLNPRNQDEQMRMINRQEEEREQGRYIYSTFGTKVIYYPYEQLTEWFGLDLCEEDIKGREINGQVNGGWINPDRYMDQNGNIQSVTGNMARINSKLNTEFEEVLHNSLISIDYMPVVGANSMDEAISREVENGLSEKRDIYGLIYGLFDMNKNENFYCHVRNNRNTIRDKLVDGLTGLVNGKLREYKNLFIIRNWLEDQETAVSLGENTRKILDFWKRAYNLAGTPDSYTQSLRDKVEYIVEKIKLPSFVLQKKEYLEEQIKNLYMLCKMHFTISILNDVKTSIDAKIADAPLDIPTMAKVDECIAKLRSVVNDGENICIYTRKNELDAEMTPSTHFIAIFNSNRDEDKRNIRMRYDQNVVANAKFTLGGLSGEYPWEYLTQTTRDGIFNDCISESKNYVQHMNLVDQTNAIEDIILRLKRNNNPQYDGIRSCIEGNKDAIVPDEVPGLIALRTTAPVLAFYTQRERIQLFYSTTNVDNFRNTLSFEDKPEAYIRTLTHANQNRADLPSLRQAVILYYDYGLVENGERTFDPVTDIDINGIVRQLVLQPRVISNKYRYPYLDREELGNILALI